MNIYAIGNRLFESFVLLGAVLGGYTLSLIVEIYFANLIWVIAFELIFFTVFLFVLHTLVEMRIKDLNLGAENYHADENDDVKKDILALELLDDDGSEDTDFIDGL